MNAPSYLIAEDEPLLAAELAAMLARQWPQAQFVGIAINGPQSIQMALQSRPDVVFLDVRMPGCDGLQVARSLYAEGGYAPLLVFVTAYDEYALAAFDAAAIDYLLKPVDNQRLARCVTRLQAQLGHDNKPTADALAQRLSQLLAPERSTRHNLRFVRVSQGNNVQMIPVDDVLFFEARDKYLRVLTRSGESLIRVALRELLAQLDPEHFWQVHRSVIVNTRAIAHAERDALGRFELILRDWPERIPVSRQFNHRFKPM